MKDLYLKLIQLLGEIPGFYVEQNFGQLQETVPPVSYPCGLISINNPSTEEIDHVFQIDTYQFEILLAFKIFSESNSLTSDKQRKLALDFYDKVDLVYKKLQGYKDDNFDYFCKKSIIDTNLRKGLKTIALRFETSQRVDIAN